MKEKALFFDFDGVVLESVDIKTQAFHAMFLPFGKDIADKVVRHHIEHGGVSRFEKFRKYYAEYLNSPINEQKVNELADEFSSIVLEKVMASKFIEGVVEFLENSQADFDCYVISGTPETELKSIVEKRGLSAFFKGVYGSPRNKITILEEILSSCSYDKSRSYFLGDASTDLEAARHHGLKFILVKSKDNKNLESDSDLVIDSFRGLKI